jgi:hypothetical protein
MTAKAGSAALAAALLLAGCNSKPVPDANSIDAIVTTGNAAEAVQEVAPDGSALAQATPMKDRVAVLGLLNKRNGASHEIKLKPGQSARVGDVIVRLRACEVTAPWELAQSTGAFVQVDVQQLDKSWHRVFSGWLFKERPAANVVQHPIYDVWVKSCAMTFKDSGPDTVSVGAGPKGSEGGGNASSAKKSPSTTGTPSASPATESPNAAPSNAM